MGFPNLSWGSSSSFHVIEPTEQAQTETKTKRISCLEKGSGRRTSIYRGVSKHKWTGRFEAHLWDKNSSNSNHSSKGRQVYLGAYDDEETAAHIYDLAALKFWGLDAMLNFSLDTYTNEYEEMQHVSKEEYILKLRRRSRGFARGASKYRGVARHHRDGRWEARISNVCGTRYVYLGTFSTQEEAAVAYDKAAIEYRGVQAMTNFSVNHYISSSSAQPQRPATPTPTPPLPPPPSSFQQSCTFTSLQEPISSPFSFPIVSDFADHSTFTDTVDASWNFCMESEFNMSPILDISMVKSDWATDLFIDNAFEESIEYLFDDNETSHPMEYQKEKKGLVDEVETSKLSKTKNDNNNVKIVDEGEESGRSDSQEKIGK